MSEYSEILCHYYIILYHVKLLKYLSILKFLKFPSFQYRRNFYNVATYLLSYYH